MSGQQVSSSGPESPVERALRTIERLDGQVGAFVTGDPERARMRGRIATGPLTGLTLGVKDIIDTADAPTSYGSPIYAGYQPLADAACVALLEAAGAVSVGKTVTTEFAFFRPGTTRNPHDLTRTPGGSSSGSAAAVACGMVDLALGSQTAASLTRPASYCGVVGFKPSFGRYALAGVKGLAPSFDTLGTIAADVATVIAADGVLAGPAPTPRRISAAAPPRVGVCRTPWWERGEAGMQAALMQAASLFAAHTTVEDVELGAFADGADLHILIMGYEAAQSLAWEYHRHKEMLSPEISRLIEAGRGITEAEYRTAVARAEEARRRAVDLFERYDVLLAPAAPGEAPAGHGGTGDPVFSRLWTLLRLPTVTLPGLVGEAGLPVGVQLLGSLGGDLPLLTYALWAERLLPPRRRVTL